MNNNGRMTDVLIEEHTYKDHYGFDTFAFLKVWMDKSALEYVKLIPGVTTVSGLDGSFYLVILDPRYDREYLKREIEAQAKIHAEE